ncbi:MAG TPA: hypothetical protein VFP59_12840 [Candidatus Angelobacter sp.]|nr:hypothetical protein [Candidatus Angelobacter sp.]
MCKFRYKPQLMRAKPSDTQSPMATMQPKLSLEKRPLFGSFQPDRSAKIKAQAIAVRCS